MFEWDIIDDLGTEVYSDRLPRGEVRRLICGAEGVFIMGFFSGLMYNDSIISATVKQHLTLNDAEALKAICQPLTTHLRAKSLVYRSVKNDGSEALLTTHPDWISYFFEQRLYEHSVFEQQPSRYARNASLWLQIPTHRDILHATREGFAIDHGITLTRPNPEGCEFFFIGADRDDSAANQLWFNNLDLLDKFIPYFKQRAARLLTKVQEKPFQIADKFTDNQLSINLIQPQDPGRANFLADIHQYGACFTLGEREISLTPREYAVAREFLQGKTWREIGAILFISPRTVETHLEHIKQKFGCDKKSNLHAILLMLL